MSRLWVGCLLGGVLAGAGAVVVLALLVTGAVLLTRGGARDGTASSGAPGLFQKGPRVYLADLDELSSKSGPWPFAKNGTAGNGSRIEVNGVPSPHGLGMHPPDLGYSAVRYRLGGQAAVFKAGVAINDTSQGGLNPAVFEVLGDGKPLWQSEPVPGPRQPQQCRVDVTGVDELELRVHAQGSHWGLHAVWVEPRLLWKLDTPDS